jgi:hypothetical protein
MREIRPYGSEGGEAKAFPTHIEGCDADKIATHTIPMLAVVIPANAGIHRDPK